MPRALEQAIIVVQFKLSYDVTGTLQLRLYYKTAVADEVLYLAVLLGVGRLPVVLL